MDILDNMGVSKLSAKVVLFFYFLFKCLEMSFQTNIMTLQKSKL